MSYKGVLVHCKKEKGDAQVCMASEIQNMTPWQLVKSISKCQERMSGKNESCALAVAYDEDTRQVVDPSKFKFDY